MSKKTKGTYSIPKMVAELGFKNYREYLASPHWSDLKAKVFARSKQCAVCGKSDGQMQVHHRTYDRLGHEFLSDLLLLCGDCHKHAHTLGPRGWRSVHMIKRFTKNLKISHKPSPYINSRKTPTVSVTRGSSTETPPWE